MSNNFKFGPRTTAQREKIAAAFGGHQIAEADGPNDSRLEFWSVGGTSGAVLVVQFYNHDAGCEIYRPASRSAVLDDTIRAALEFVGR